VKIGIHAPLDERQTGVATYARAIASALACWADIELNPRRECDVELYHLGNNPLHRRVYERALNRPGVVVLHDAVLNHFHLGVLDEPRYVAEFVYNYGEWYRDFATALWRRRARAAQEPVYFHYPMIRRVVERALAVVVHNPAAAEIARAHGARHVVEIPHIYLPARRVPAARVERFRKKLGLGAGEVLFGVLGFLRESKRILPVLRLFRRLEGRLREARLVVAGRFVSESLARACEPYWKLSNVIRLGYLDEEEFGELLEAVDVGMNLRWPAAGETSGITIRQMGVGKTVVVSDTLENARFPAGTVVRLPAGVDEAEALEWAVTWLARFPLDAKEVGRRAAWWISQEHSPQACASQYWQVIQRAARQDKVDG